MGRHAGVVSGPGPKSEVSGRKSRGRAPVETSRRRVDDTRWLVSEEGTVGLSPDVPRGALVPCHTSLSPYPC